MVSSPNLWYYLNTHNKVFVIAGNTVAQYVHAV